MCVQCNAQIRLWMNRNGTICYWKFAGILIWLIDCGCNKPNGDKTVKKCECTVHYIPLFVEYKCLFWYVRMCLLITKKWCRKMQWHSLLKMKNFDNDQSIFIELKWSFQLRQMLAWIRIMKKKTLHFPLIIFQWNFH